MCRTHMQNGDAYAMHVRTYGRTYEELLTVELIGFSTSRARAYTKLDSFAGLIGERHE